MSRLPTLFHKHPILIFAVSLSIIVGAFLLLVFFQNQNANKRFLSLSSEKTKATESLDAVTKELKELQNQDQVKINLQNAEEIKNIQTTYQKAVTAYETLIEFKATSKVKPDDYDKLFALSLKQLSDKNYASADASLTQLTRNIQTEKDKAATAFTIPTNVTANNSAPVSGYARQQVSTNVGNFLIDIVSADLGSTRVIVDTASDSDCRDNCPVLSLGDYIGRNGAFAGVNGTYFCPAAYPTCAGKTNTFDLLVMNKNKKYLNSDNNVYSTNPAVIFMNGSIRFVGQALEWGRDTGVDGVLSNYPLLLSGGNITFGGDADPKKGGKGSRSFVGNKGSTVYIGVTHNVTVVEMAHALKALGLENALNLDSGGSTALWSGGYKVGPGRNIPNAILFVRK